jgi:hypothetical protein
MSINGTFIKTTHAMFYILGKAWFLMRNNSIFFIIKYLFNKHKSYHIMFLHEKLHRLLFIHEKPNK